MMDFFLRSSSSIFFFQTLEYPSPGEAKERRLLFGEVGFEEVDQVLAGLWGGLEEGVVIGGVGVEGDGDVGLLGCLVEEFGVSGVDDVVVVAVDDEVGLVAEMSD